MKNSIINILLTFFMLSLQGQLKNFQLKNIIIDVWSKFAKIIMNLHIAKTCIMVPQKILLITRFYTYSVGRETVFQPFKCCPFMPAGNKTQVPMLLKFLQQVMIRSLKRELQVHQAILPLHLRDQSCKKELQAMPALLFCFSPGPV